MKYLVKNSFILSLILAVFALLAIPMLISWNALTKTITDDMQDVARRELILLSSLFIEEANISKDRAENLLDDFAIDYMRVSFIDDSGQVLYDSEISAEELSLLDNHAKRQEILAAQNFGLASSIRYSTTLSDNLIYAAMPVKETKFFPEGVLRIALPSSQRLSYINDLMKDFFIVLTIFLIFTFFITSMQNKRLKLAIEQMKHIIDNTGLETKTTPALPQKPEFIELSQSVAKMAARVEGQLKTNLSQKIELEGILNSLDAGVLVLDSNGTIIKINSAFQKLLPQFFKNNVEESIGKHTIEVFNNSLCEEYIKEAMQSDILFFSHEITINDKTFQLNITKPIPNPHFKLEISMVIVLHDITQMSNLIEIKRDLIANASHELRTPLTAIQGYAETLHEITKTYSSMIPDAQRFLNIIIKNAKHLDCIVTDLLSLSSIENVNTLDENASTTIHDALDIAQAECQILLDKKNVSIVNQLNLDTKLNIEQDRLAQVFRNLIENACRYSQDNASIVLHSEIIQQDKEYCKISIQDYGRGIPQGELNRVFERFYRVEKHRSDSTISTGLGLSLCKHIIESYKGSIYAEYHAPSLLQNHQHVGATIRFTLPIYK